ncbi:hypothetical protein [Candidatus Leptofilum sp.]|uniref:hypothetical protein n=1 Tax=Candidatus Leptofilum sp. TaxID=3241576 RepID=UPI003B595E5E
MTYQSPNDSLFFFDMMRSIQILTWEFIQNLPLVAGLILALQFWRQEQWGTAVATIMAGSIIGSLLIRFTEAKIVTKRREPISVTITNIIVMSLLMLAVVAYVNASWSNWQVDLIVGALGGALLSAAQNLAAKKRIGVKHMLAFVFAFSVALIVIRTLVDILPTVATILLITIIVTVVISLVDYDLLRSHT